MARASCIPLGVREVEWKGRGGPSQCVEEEAEVEYEGHVPFLNARVEVRWGGRVPVVVG